MRKDQIIEGLCLGCGLCCDGTLFGDVRLGPTEDSDALSALGLKLNARGSIRSLKQPCPALKGTRCEAYAVRPCHCQQFECRLFQSVQSGETTLERAQVAIRATQKQANKIRRQMSHLEGAKESGARQDLRQRFTRLARRMETSTPTPEDAALFGELTLAFHRLNVRLRKFFVDS